MFLRELLVEAQEVAEAPPHREGLVAEHGQRGLKRPFADVGVSSSEVANRNSCSSLLDFVVLSRPVHGCVSYGTLMSMLFPVLCVDERSPVWQLCRPCRRSSRHLGGRHEVINADSNAHSYF